VRREVGKADGADGANETDSADRRTGGPADKHEATGDG